MLREGTEDDRKGAPPYGGSRTGVQEGQEQESRSRSREALWSITGPGFIPKACWVLCKDAYLCPTLVLFSWTRVNGIHESLSLELFYALSDPRGSRVPLVTALWDEVSSKPLVRALGPCPSSFKAHRAPSPELRGDSL